MPIFSINSQQNPLMKREHADGHVTILHSFMHPKESTLFKILHSWQVYSAQGSVWDPQPVWLLWKR